MPCGGHASHARVQVTSLSPTMPERSARSKRGVLPWLAHRTGRCRASRRRPRRCRSTPQKRCRPERLSADTEQHDARHHRADGQHGRNEAGEAFCVFQADSQLTSNRPAMKIDPGHFVSADPRPDAARMLRKKPSVVNVTPQTMRSSIRRLATAATATASLETLRISSATKCETIGRKTAKSFSHSGRAANTLCREFFPTPCRGSSSVARQTPSLGPSVC